MGGNSKTLLLVGTHKGGFLFSSDADRRKWEMKGPFFRGTDVNHLILDARGRPTLHACVNSTWWGPDTRRSEDWGETWLEPETPARFAESAERKVKRVWCVAAGPEGDPGTLYAGVDPAALFRSRDGGRTWTEIEALSQHPSREKWTPGMGGMMVHSICPHPVDGDVVQVAISAAGAFATADGGATWEARNRGVRANYLPEEYPVVGQCVHHLERHPAQPQTLYQQSHDGVYRSDDEGANWVDISEGLPSRFGFPLRIHPRDPDTVYVIPEEGAEFRCPVGAEFAVYRSRDRGSKWEKLGRGLPSENAFLNVYRQAMAVDSHDPGGVYVGTSTGQIFYSRDEGETWETLATWLPPVYSVSAAVMD